ncbi:MAG: nicotinate-nucleotide--dimethylbenzimidazole phosphoribosyltransferase [Caulobacterales bacterium]|nr:nicotinate-nucleotide--dimethylbenzimidazole phosphoribosyltransferase [Caulobacterales bacterium]
MRRAIDSKTKPVGALGRVEELAMQIARVQGTLAPRMSACRHVIFAADHGMAAAGVSAYPQAVTRQMVANFLAGGAAANVFAAVAGVALSVVDAGVAGAPLVHDGLISRRIGPGTADAVTGPAMSAGERDAALEAGRAIGAEGEHEAASFGEMGIGATSAASLIAHKLSGLGLAELTGRGTGLDDDGLDRKRALLERAAARTPRVLEAPEALAEYGGFEIVMMCGAMMGAARAGKLVLVDGFIATAAALAAIRLDGDVRANLVFAHRSAERGHEAVLEAIGARALLDLDMRLGEGAGALLAWPLVRAAAAMLTDMASFESAEVSGPA